MLAAGSRVEGGDALAGPAHPVLLASNHASYVDVLALLALLPRDFVFAAKEEVARWPCLGTLVRRAGHLTVERFDVSQSVVDAGKLARALEQGRSVLLFPEGTFTAAAGLRPFRLGTFKAAVETESPSCPSPCAGRARSCARGRWCRARDRCISGSATPSPRTATDGTPWSRSGIAWPPKSRPIAGAAARSDRGRPGEGMTR